MPTRPSMWSAGPSLLPTRRPSASSKSRMVPGRSPRRSRSCFGIVIRPFSLTVVFIPRSYEWRTATSSLDIGGVDIGGGAASAASASAAPGRRRPPQFSHNRIHGLVGTDSSRREPAGADGTADPRSACGQNSRCESESSAPRPNPMLISLGRRLWEDRGPWTRIGALDEGWGPWTRIGNPGRLILDGGVAGKPISDLGSRD